MASNKKKLQPTDEMLEQQEGPLASEDNEGGEPNADGAEEEPSDEGNDPSADGETAEEPADETEGTNDDEGNLMTSEQPATVIATDLHARLSKAARALSTHGQEKHFAVHQLEHLTGKLKMVLPAGIAAVEDQDLKAGLQTLLNLL